MTTLHRADVNVPTGALRRALLSVIAHVPTEDTEDHLRNRICVYVQPEYLALTATGGQTAAVARVEINENRSGEIGVFHLHPGDVKKILQLFNPPTKELSSHVLRIEREEKHLIVSDVGGLFPGESLQLNSFALDPEFPNIPAAISAVRALGQSHPDRHRVVVPGYRIARFQAAAKQYGDSLVMDPYGRRSALVVTCTSQFIGILLPDWMAQDDHLRADGRVHDWSDRFADLTYTHPVAPPKQAPKERPKREPADPEFAGLDSMLAGPEYAIDLDALEPDEPGDIDPDPDDTPVVESAPMFQDGPDERAHPLLTDDDADILLSAVQEIAGSELTSIRLVRGLFNCGYNRAEKILDLLERAGFVSPATANQPRRVLVDVAGLPAAIEYVASLRRSA